MNPNEMFRAKLLEISHAKHRMKIAAERSADYQKVSEAQIADILTILGNPNLRDQLMMGIEVEKEHGRYGPKDGAFDVAGVDLHKCAFIAAAHIAEVPDYYDRLKKMEEEGKAYWASKGVELDD